MLARAMYQYPKNIKENGTPAIKTITNLKGIVAKWLVCEILKIFLIDEVWQFFFIKLANKKIKKLTKAKLIRKKNSACIDSIDCIPIAETIKPMFEIEKKIQINFK